MCYSRDGRADRSAYAYINGYSLVLEGILSSYVARASLGRCDCLVIDCSAAARRVMLPAECISSLTPACVMSMALKEIALALSLTPAHV
jgi:hypothetical protein